MAIIEKRDKWYVVEVDGQLIGQFVHSLDAHRHAIAMMHDGLVEAVTLLTGVQVTR